MVINNSSDKKIFNSNIHLILLVLGRSIILYLLLGILFTIFIYFVFGGKIEDYIDFRMLFIPGGFTAYFFFPMYLILNGFIIATTKKSQRSFKFTFILGVIIAVLVSILMFVIGFYTGIFDNL